MASTLATDTFCHMSTVTYRCDRLLTARTAVPLSTQGTACKQRKRTFPASLTPGSTAVRTRHKSAKEEPGDKRRIHKDRQRGWLNRLFRLLNNKAYYGCETRYRKEKEFYNT